MTRKRSLLLLLPVLLAAGLYLLADRFLPHIVHHEKPNLSVDVSPFAADDCGGESGGYCTPLSATQSLECSAVLSQPLFGGLSPQYPIIVCRIDTPGLPTGDEQIPGECIYSSGFFVSGCYQYIIFKDNRYERIDTLAAFRRVFAPVESPEEALGFALASGDYHARYGQVMDPRLVYYVSRFEDTYVKTIQEGYLVQLFYTPIFGCGPFVTEAVEIKVTYDGVTTPMRRFPVHRNPEQDKFCVD
jgi:hypothetical protein